MDVQQNSGSNELKGEALFPKQEGPPIPKALNASDAVGERKNVEKVLSRLCPHIEYAAKERKPFDEQIKILRTFLDHPHITQQSSLADDQMSTESESARKYLEDLPISENVIYILWSVKLLPELPPVADDNDNLYNNLSEDTRKKIDILLQLFEAESYRIQNPSHYLLQLIEREFAAHRRSERILDSMINSAKSTLKERQYYLNLAAKLLEPIDSKNNQEEQEKAFDSRIINLREFLWASTEGEEQSGVKIIEGKVKRARKYYSTLGEEEKLTFLLSSLGILEIPPANDVQYLDLYSTLDKKSRSIVQALISTTSGESRNEKGCCETVLNLIEAMTGYTTNPDHIFRELVSLVKRLKDMNLPGKFHPLATDQRASISIVLGVSAEDRRMIRRNHSEQPGWGIEHEMITLLACHMSKRPNDAVVLELFLVFAKLGLERIESNQRLHKIDEQTAEEQKEHLVMHAGFMLDLALRIINLQDATAIVKNESTTDKTNLSSMNWHFQRGLTSLEVNYNGILKRDTPFDKDYETVSFLREFCGERFDHLLIGTRRLTLSNISELQNYYGKLPTREEYLTFLDMCERLSSSQLDKDILLSLSCKFLDRLKQLQKRGDTSSMITPAIVLVHAVTSLELREKIERRLRDHSANGKIDESVLRKKIAAEEAEALIHSFLKKIKPQYYEAIIDLFAQRDLSQHETRRLSMVLRIIAPFEHLFDRKEEFVKACNQLFHSAKLTDAALQELPIVLRRLNPEHSEHSQKNSYSIYSIEELFSVIETTKRIMSRRPWEELRTLRVTVELMTLLAEKLDPKKKFDANEALQFVDKYFSECGVEALPICFAAFFYVEKRVSRIDERLGKFVSSIVNSVDKVQRDSLYLIAPLVHNEELRGTVKSITNALTRGETLDETVYQVYEQFKRGSSFSDLYGSDLSALQALTGIKSESEKMRAFGQWMLEAQKRTLLEVGNGFKIRKSPLFVRDPIGIELHLHAMSILHREFSSRERHLWPSVVNHPIPAAVSHISRLLSATERLNLEDSDQDLRWDDRGKEVNFRADSELFLNGKTSDFHEVVEPAISAIVARRLAYLIDNLTRKVLFARELGSEGFVYYWRRHLAKELPSNITRSELFKALKAAKNTDEWINILANSYISDEEQRNSTATENSEDTVVKSRVLDPALADHLFLGLVANVQIDALPEWFPVLTKPESTIKDLRAKAHVLFELSTSVLMPKNEFSFISDDESVLSVLREFTDQLFSRNLLTNVISQLSMRSTEETKRIQMVCSRGFPLATMGHISKICATKLLTDILHNPMKETQEIRDDLTRENMFAIIYLDSDRMNGEEELTADRPFVLGATGVILVHDKEGAPCLLLRAINPRPELLQMVSAAELYTKTVDLVIDFAKKHGFEKVLTPDARNSCRNLSNRPEIVHHQVMHYGRHPRTVIPDNEQSTVYNSNRVKGDVVEVWRRQQEKE